MVRRDDPLPDEDGRQRASNVDEDGEDRDRDSMLDTLNKYGPINRSRLNLIRELGFRRLTTRDACPALPILSAVISTRKSYAAPRQYMPIHSTNAMRYDPCQSYITNIQSLSLLSTQLAGGVDDPGCQHDPLD